MTEVINTTFIAARMYIHFSSSFFSLYVINHQPHKSQVEWWKNRPRAHLYNPGFWWLYHWRPTTTFITLFARCFCCKNIGPPFWSGSGNPPTRPPAQLAHSKMATRHPTWRPDRVGGWVCPTAGWGGPTSGREGFTSGWGKMIVEGGVVDQKVRLPNVCL